MILLGYLTLDWIHKIPGIEFLTLVWLIHYIRLNMVYQNLAILILTTDDMDNNKLVAVPLILCKHVG